MADLVAIGYPDETTATAAADEARRLAKDLIPVFGLAIGAGMGALMGKLSKTSIDSQFQDQVRGMQDALHGGQAAAG